MDWAAGGAECVRSCSWVLSVSGVPASAAGLGGDKVVLREWERGRGRRAHADVPRGSAVGSAGGKQAYSGAGDRLVSAWSERKSGRTVRRRKRRHRRPPASSNVHGQPWLGSERMVQRRTWSRRAIADVAEQGHVTMTSTGQAAPVASLSSLGRSVCSQLSFSPSKRLPRDGRGARPLVAANSHASPASVPAVSALPPYPSRLTAPSFLIPTLGYSTPVRACLMPAEFDTNPSRNLSPLALPMALNVASPSNHRQPGVLPPPV
ncbi:hypothetical protein C8Q79DRAFT_277893 [Trametes meyenii]|nr:hypothetical protein C8Q79DRAFT_277893 [Trametes meyenii]